MSAPSSETQMPSKAPASLALLVASAFFMEMLDSTIIGPAIPQMAADFGCAPANLSIGISAYLVTVAVFIPLSGWIAARLGARKVFTSAILLFAVASLLCSLSSSLEFFTFARILQGIGGALMVPVGRLVVLQRYPKHKLMKAIATITWPGLAAPVIGPALGGILSQHLSWQWIFLINLPIAIAGIAFSLILMPRSNQNRETLPFDALGFMLSALACMCIMSAIEGIAHSQGHSLALTLLLLVGCLLAAGTIRHMHRTQHPLFALTPLTYGAFRTSLSSGSLFRLAINQMPFVLPLMFQLGFGMSSSQAGLMLLVLFAGNLSMKPMTSSILRLFGFRRVLIVNGLIQTLAIAACALVSPQTNFTLVLIVLFIAGLSRSMQYTGYNTLAFSEMPDRHMRAANTLFSISDQLFTGLSIALAALVLQTLQHISGHAQLQMSDFHLALFTGALISAVSTLIVLSLSRSAGAEITQRTARR